MPETHQNMNPEHSTDPTADCIAFRDLTVGYEHHAAIHHLSGCLARGSLTALVGPNGSGKSTLIKTIAGLLRPMSGTCRVAPGLSIAWLPQLSELDRSFPARVRDLVALGLWRKRGLLGRTHPECRKAIVAALRAVGLEGFDTRPLDSLSGGQLQRALFARLMVQDADLILLDEPFNAVDERTIRDLLAQIHRWRDEGRTVVVVAHDLDLVRAEFPQALLLARRPIAWGPTAEVVTPQNMQRARQFQEAWDERAPWCEPSSGIMGQTP